MASSASRSSVKRKVIPIALCCAVPLLVIGSVMYFGIGPFDIGPAGRQAEQAAAEYRKEGLPWEVKDMNPGPPVADQDNAAPLLREAIVLVRPMSTKDGAKFTQAEAWGDLGTWLKGWEHPLALATQASLRPGLDFGRDYDLGPTMLFPEYAPIKDMVKVLSMRARLRASQGDVDGCSADLLAGFRLSALIGREPYLIGMLVDIAGQAIALDGIRRSAALLNRNVLALSKLGTCVSQMHSLPNFATSLRSEAYMGLATLRNLKRYGGLAGLMHLMAGTSYELDPSLAKLPLVRTGLPDGWTARAFAARHLQLWTEASRKMGTLGDDPEAQGKVLEDIAVRVGEDRRLSYVLEKAMMPVFSQAGLALVRSEANYRTTAALVSALKKAAETGDLATRIEDIPGTWIDPFSKQPLRVVRKGNSIRIYSVGPNRKDEGGLTRAEMEGSDDIVAAYPLVKTIR